MSELHEYLASAAGQGRHDSSGRFTLDPARARELLAQFRMRGAEDCLLKWVQAAVVAQAAEVRVTLGRQQTILLAKGCQVPLRQQEIHEFLGRPLERSRSPARHLAVGLLAAWKAYPAHLTLEWWEEGQVHRLDLRGEEIHSGQDPWTLEEGEFRIKWRRRLAGDFWERFRRLLRGQLREASALNACRYAVSPVLVDARPLLREGGPTVLVGRDGHLTEVRPHFALLVAYLRAHAGEPEAFLTDRPAGVAFRGLGGRVQRTEDTIVSAGVETLAGSEPLRRFFPSGRGSASERTLAVWARLEVRAGCSGPARVLFIHDGVVVEERRVPLGIPGAVAWVSAAKLTTDLSEFKLLEDDSYRRLIKGLQNCLLETVGRHEGELRALLRGNAQTFKRLQGWVPGLRALPAAPKKPKVRATRAHDDRTPPPPKTLKPNDHRPR